LRKDCCARTGASLPGALSSGGFVPCPRPCPRGSVAWGALRGGALIEPWARCGRWPSTAACSQSQGRSVAQEKDKEAGVVPHTFLHRPRSRMDEVRLARVALRLEAALGMHRGWRVDTARRKAHPRQRLQQPGGPAADSRSCPMKRASCWGTRTTKRPKRARGLPGGRDVLGDQCGRRGPYPHTDAGVEVRRISCTG
jgi:hypothetical protein